MEDRWGGVVGLLGSESFPEFLRVFWNSRNRLVRKVDLFKTMRSAISDRASVFQLIRDMDRHARVYSALRSPGRRLLDIRGARKSGPVADVQRAPAVSVIAGGI